MRKKINLIYAFPGLGKSRFLDNMIRIKGAYILLSDTDLFRLENQVYLDRQTIDEEWKKLTHEERKKKIKNNVEALISHREITLLTNVYDFHFLDWDYLFNFLPDETILKTLYDEDYDDKWKRTEVSFDIYKMWYYDAKKFFSTKNTRRKVIFLKERLSDHFFDMIEEKLKTDKEKIQVMQSVFDHMKGE